MFVTTANSMNIPSPLLDRMEVVNISGYTEDEKVSIALKYLVPKQIGNAGLKSKEIKFLDSAIRGIIRFYSREAGVRNLERQIANICRKVVRGLLTKPSSKAVTISEKSLEKYLGVKKYRFGVSDDENRVGQVTGLAWTEVGGDLLTIESAVMPGKGCLLYTSPSPRDS